MMKYIVRDIERAVCQRFKLTPERLRGAERQRKIARPRQIAMYLARELTGASLPQIGRYFARDHTTVIHACKKIAAMAEQGGRMPTYLAEIRAILGEARSARLGPPMIWSGGPNQATNTASTSERPGGVEANCNENPMKAAQK